LLLLKNSLPVWFYKILWNLKKFNCF
jgi:hypothetical protein